MRYKETPIDRIKPYEKNPRIITQAAIDQAARSIAAFGFIKPIIVDADGVILAGHTRLKAAQKIGMERVPVLWVDEVTPEKARAYRIADNKLGEATQWDRGLLDKELNEIAGRSFDALDALGLEQWELDRLSKAGETDASEDTESDPSYISASEYRAQKHKARTGRDDYAEMQAEKRPVAPAQLRVLVSIEDDIDEACIRRALGLSPADIIPSVINFNDIKTGEK